MPRMTGINSKALEAKQRKREQREAQERKQQEELLDKYWEDNDKLVKAKQERKVLMLFLGIRFNRWRRSGNSRKSCNASKRYDN